MNYLTQYKKKRVWDKKHKIQAFIKNAYYFIIWGISRRINNIRYEIKWGFQRMFRGYDDTAFWGLDSYLMDIALPVLKQYKKRKTGIPLIKGFEKRSFKEQEIEWYRILGKMIKAFQLMKNEDTDFRVHNKKWYKKHNKQIEEGLELFARYYRGLWD